MSKATAFFPGTVCYAQLNCGGAGRHAVMAPVVDQELAVEHQAGTVVAAELEGIAAGLVDLEVAVESKGERVGPQPVVRAPALKVAVDLGPGVDEDRLIEAAAFVCTVADWDTPVAITSAASDV